MLVIVTGAVLLFFCTAVQAVITLFLIRKLGSLQHKGYFHKNLFMVALIFEAVAGVLVLSFLLQILIWALAYLWIGEFSEFETAFYFSGVTYATLGYGDVILSGKWRVLGPFEALNGLIMGGFAASVFFTVTSRMLSSFWKQKNPPPKE